VIDFDNETVGAELFITTVVVVTEVVVGVVATVVGVGATVVGVGAIVVVVGTTPVIEFELLDATEFPM
jgi:hypothetical protein